MRHGVLTDIGVNVSEDTEDPKGMRIGDALRLMAETDDEYGTARGRVKALEALMKRCESIEMLKHDGGVDMRKAHARASEVYGRFVAEYEEACYRAEILGAKRDTAALVIAAWQTKSANLRKGNVV